MFKTEDAAEQAGRRVKAQLDALWPKWTLRVWENFGWHYDLRRGPVSLSASSGVGFMVLICNRPESDGSGTMLVPYAQFAKTAASCVRLAAISFRAAWLKKIEEMQAVLDGLPEGK